MAEKVAEAGPRIEKANPERVKTGLIRRSGMATAGPGTAKAKSLRARVEKKHNNAFLQKLRKSGARLILDVHDF